MLRKMKFILSDSAVLHIIYIGHTYHIERKSYRRQCFEYSFMRDDET